MSALMRQIIEHKRQRRVALAALSYPEKVKIVERMREAIISIKAKGAAQMPDSVNHGLNRLAGA
jgi:hypothetical protein